MHLIESESRAAVAALGSGAPGSLRNLCDYALAELDFERLAEIGERFGASRKSYFDVSRYLAIQHRLALKIGLDRSPQLSILDLAAGPCYFGFVCRFFGHDCVGLDKPKRPLLAELAAWLGVAFIPAELRAGEPLPPTPRVDLVTALRASFHQKTRSLLWALDEWRFFLDDLRNNHLKPGGRMHLMMNRQDGCDRVHVYDPEFVRFAERQGGTVIDGGTVLLPARVAATPQPHAS